MAREIPDPTTWLHNRPSEGIASKWYARNMERFQVRGGLRILDMAVLLLTSHERWDGNTNTPFTLDKVNLRKTGPEVYPTGPELPVIWQNLSHDLRQRGERIDPKAHLYSYLEKEDGTLDIVISNSDWTKMALGPMLRDGKIPGEYRDDILPMQSPGANENTSIFDSPLPNHLVLHLALLTADNHLILTTRSRNNVAFEQGTISASVEQHINPESDKSLDDSINATVSNKFKDEAELNLTLRPETLRVGAILIEPNVNNTGIVVVGSCEEDSSQVGDELIGSNRRSEFASDHPVRTLSLDDPSKWAGYFLNPDHLLHGTSRIRMEIVLTGIYGYENFLDIVYEEYKRLFNRT